METAEKPHAPAKAMVRLFVRPRIGRKRTQRTVAAPTAPVAVSVAVPVAVQVAVPVAVPVAAPVAVPIAP